MRRCVQSIKFYVVALVRHIATTERNKKICIIHNKYSQPLPFDALQIGCPPLQQHRIITLQHKIPQFVHAIQLKQHPRHLGVTVATQAVVLNGVVNQAQGLQVAGVLVMRGLQVDAVLVAGGGDGLIPQACALVEFVQHVEAPTLTENRRCIVEQT